MRQAEAEFRRDNLKAIQSDPDWPAKAWLLERIRPDEHGPKDRRSDELDKPRQGLVVEAEVVHRIHPLLDEAKKQGLVIGSRRTKLDAILVKLEAPGLSADDRATLRLQGEMISRLMIALTRRSTRRQRGPQGRWQGTWQARTARPPPGSPSRVPLPPPDPVPVSSVLDF